MGEPESIPDSDNGGNSTEPETSKLPPHLKKIPAMKGARNRIYLKPRQQLLPTDAPPLPARHFIPLPSNADFDEYYLGPTIEDCASYPRYLDNFPTNPYAMVTHPSIWDIFKDYGYRLEPSFALMFNNERPELVREHLLPIGRPSHPDRSCSEPYSLSREGEPRDVAVIDVAVMGLEKMLEEAGDPGSDASIDAFVLGKTMFQDHIQLDLAQDSIQLSESEIKTTYDIDSIIWVTRRLELCQSPKVFVLPYEGKRAPIHVNNHVYVEVLMPRSDRDKDAGLRYEWFSKPFPLSAIPHTHFAKLGDGAGSINIYVLFPRMINRHPLTGRRVTNIPAQIQTLWLDQVVLPSIIASAPEGTMEYVDYTLEEWRWKASCNKRFVNSKTAVVQTEVLGDMQHFMRKIIEADSDELCLFGSFFFVCDARGIKGLTHDERGNPYERLQREYPSLDWNYAMDRKNGQLFLDLGISFHPASNDLQPLIGLWKLPSVEASFAAAGMTKGKTHHANTLADYGGKQADMEQQRSRVVQLPFRSTYNLVFEAIRRPGTKEYFCEDADAYDAGPNFTECCKKYISLFQGSGRKSFGVREEVRGSGPAIKEALIHARERASLSRESCSAH